MCGSREVPSLLPSFDPICRSNVPGTGYLASGDPNHKAHGAGHCPQANCTAHGHRSQHSWTRSSPCFRSKGNKHEYCVFTDSTFAENRGTTLVTTAERAAYLERIPAYTDPSVTKGINQDIIRTKPAKYKVEKIEGKGLGVIATGFINRGELIMANTVSLMFDYAAYENLERDDYLDIQAQAVDSLPEAHRRLILDMSTHDEGNFTYLELVEKITSTNAFDVDPDDDDVDQDNKFYVIFPEIARMNHDCRPAADYYFDLETLTQYVHAVRPIYPGEEITVTYIDPTMRQAARAHKLHDTWGFRCACPSCTASRPAIAASDDRLRQIEELRPEFNKFRSASRATPQMAELLVSLYEQERLWGMMDEAYRYAAVEWNAVGEPWTATKYARLAIEHGIYLSGEKDGDVADMDELAADPWSHWSWMMRMKGRTGWKGRKGVAGDDED
ncbi:SET domain-containing protein [Coniochaeta ligniaria NRRL 30616]|uniref:SET domain-containing protein n=1 Tax=Coniochaeta ligniaria NRRL 30616 TaxID=1408157 RepID=A0A1J7J152_9PEZI|nr:SET domain-containing protein [Coniochaeta ligniaria NRRL 30616]